MAGKLVRNTSTPELRRWWRAVEQAAAQAPKLETPMAKPPPFPHEAADQAFIDAAAREIFDTMTEAEALDIIAYVLRQAERVVEGGSPIDPRSIIAALEALHWLRCDALPGNEAEVPPLEALEALFSPEAPESELSHYIDPPRTPAQLQLWRACMQLGAHMEAHPEQWPMHEPPTIDPAGRTDFDSEEHPEPEFAEVARRTVADERGVLQALEAHDQAEPTRRERDLAEHPEPESLEGAQHPRIVRRLRVTGGWITRFEAAIAATEHALAGRKMDDPMRQHCTDALRSQLASLREDEAHLLASPAGCADAECSRCYR